MSRKHQLQHFSIYDFKGGKDRFTKITFARFLIIIPHVILYLLI